MILQGAVAVVEPLTSPAANAFNISGLTDCWSYRVRVLCAPIGRGLARIVSRLAVRTSRKGGSDQLHRIRFFSIWDVGQGGGRLIAGGMTHTYLTITVAPAVTRAYSSIMSSFSMRIQPEEASVPMVQGSDVPWMR